MAGRKAPELPEKERLRRQALLDLDVAAMRRWLARYAVGALGNDQVVLLSMHQARIDDPEMPQEAREQSLRYIIVLSQHG